MVKEMVCIICPRGCSLKVDENNVVTGNTCIRGEKYAISELTNPVRTLTTSVRINNREDTLVSVKTDCAIPKGKIFELMKLINQVSISAPCNIGDVVLEKPLGIDCRVVVTKNID